MRPFATGAKFCAIMQISRVEQRVPSHGRQTATARNRSAAPRMASSSTALQSLDQILEEAGNFSWWHALRAGYSWNRTGGECHGVGRGLPIERTQPPAHPSEDPGVLRCGELL
jgi:hypothetical protein